MFRKVLVTLLWVSIIFSMLGSQVFASNFLYPYVNEQNYWNSCSAANTTVIVDKIFADCGFAKDGMVDALEQILWEWHFYGTDYAVWRITDALNNHWFGTGT